MFYLRARGVPKSVATDMLTLSFLAEAVDEIEEETLREAQNWPEGTPFETLEPMMRITLNAILRAVFGAERSIIAQRPDLLKNCTVVESARIGLCPVGDRGKLDVADMG